MNFSQWQTPYTIEGREHIYTRLKGYVAHEVAKLMKSNIPIRSVEYFDNRISRYSMKQGKCEITGEFLPAEFVHCHHYVPKSLGGTDGFNNLRILNILIHILVHATDVQTIRKYLDMLNPNNKAIKNLNDYRKKCNLEPIS
jgi:RNA-directed DNA polymerase